MAWTNRIKGRKTRRAGDQARHRWSAPRTAFVLSGGGVLGAVQVGQLKALIEADVVPDVVVASSVGTLNAAMVACDPTPAAMEYMASVWRGLRAEDIFPGSRVMRAWNIVARGDHLHSNEGIRRLVEKLPVRTFEQTRIPLHVCTTNLTTGEERWFDSGPLARAILASTALPGIFPPVAIDGQLYADGGIVNNVPISKAVELDARRIYVLTCGTVGAAQQLRPIRRPIDVLIQAFAHSRAVRYAIDMERFSSQAEIIMIPAVDVGFVRYNDPSHSRELIESAYEATKQFLTASSEAQA